MTKILLLTCVVLAALGPVLTVPKFKINPTLQASLSTQSTHDVVVNFRKKTTSVLNSVGLRNFATRAEKLHSLSDQLETLAKTTQKSIIELLNSSAQQRLAGMTFQSFWVSNQVFVQKADASLIQAMAQLDEVEEIREQLIIHLAQPKKFEIKARDFKLEWGIQKIGAELLWAENINGTGIVVGGIDTGVRQSHQELRDNYIGGDFGWSDKVYNSATPEDGQGHGTHTMGTIVGQSGIGVAPGAKWMACRACNNDGQCGEVALLACGQFMTCPNPNNQEGVKNCSYAPNIVSNSWGGPGDDNYYDAVIEAWHAAGIIPVFAIGNEGPECSTLGSPGDRDVIGVGSTTLTDALSDFSSVGPSRLNSKLIKPDLVAPGQDILSAYYLSNSSYAESSGSSMAAPHVAGLIALMLQNNATLKYAEIRNQLIAGTTQKLVSTGRKCGDIDSLTFPNHAFGNGRIRAWESLYGTSSSVQNMAGMVFVIIAVLGNINY